MMFGGFGFESLFRKMDPYASFHPGSQFMIGDRTHKRRHWKKAVRKRKIARTSRKKKYKILGKRG